MESLVRDVLKMGLFDANGQREEMSQFLAIVQRLTELLTQRAGPEEIGSEVVRIIVEEANVGNCSILLWDEKKECLSLLAAFGMHDLLRQGNSLPYNGKLQFGLSEGMAGKVFQVRKAAFVEDVARSSLPTVADSIIQPISLACLPLLEMGVLNISTYFPYEFSPQLRRNWELLSKIIGYLLTRASLHEQAPSNGRGKATGEIGRERDPVPEPSFIPLAERLSVQVMDRAPQGIGLMDSDGNMVRVNNSLLKLQGCEEKDILGRSPGVFFHDARVFAGLREEIKSSDHVELPDVSLVGPKGQLYLADVYLAKLTTSEGLLTGYLLVVTDMTKKKAFAEKMVRTEKLAALGTMAGGVAHDFNNLLMAILGNIQMILHQTTDPETRRRLQNIEKAVHDGAHTVRRLQKFTERDREHRSSPGTVEMGEAVKDVIELTRPRWKNAMEKFGHTIHFSMELEPDCMAVVHASDLREVLTNLIFNAIEAMPEGGALRVSSRSSASWVLLEISDSGIGMSEEVSRRIFDPFYTTKGVGNSGLGLSVSWSLINRYGGDIQVKSKPGKGTTFVIRLPGAEPQKPVPMSASAAMGDLVRHVLVVDDETEVLEILRDMLRLKGHRVVATDDGQRALDLIGKEKFDLVLTDLGMPVVSGWDIARHTKETDPLIPVVLITGWGAQYEEEDLSRHGVDLVLSKPLSWDKLMGTVEKLLSSSKNCRLDPS